MPSSRMACLPGLWFAPTSVVFVNSTTLFHAPSKCCPSAEFTSRNVDDRCIPLKGEVNDGGKVKPTSPLVLLGSFRSSMDARGDRSGLRLGDWEGERGGANSHAASGIRVLLVSAPRSMVLRVISVKLAYRSRKRCRDLKDESDATSDDRLV